jgi:hypothetical protein
MSIKRKTYTGSIDWVPGTQIYLDVNNLKDGLYNLKIVQNNKLIKEVTFKKNKK